MGLETATYISGLNASNPVNATDVVGEGDDHLRLIKSTLLNTFPNLTGAMTRTQAQLNNTLIKNEAGNIISEGNVPSNPTLTLETTRPVLVFDDTNAAVDEGRWYIHSSAGQLAIVPINDANAASQNCILIDRTGINIDSIKLYTDNVVSFETLGSGDCRIRSDGSTDTEVRRLMFSHQDGTQRASFGQEGSGLLYIRNLIHGDSIRMTAENAVGTTAIMIDADPDALVTLYYDGQQAVRTHAAGLHIADSGAGADPFIGFYDAGFLARQGYIQFNNSNGVLIAGEVHGLPVKLQAEDAGGTVRSLVIADPDGTTDLYYNGTQRFRTLSGGGLRVQSDASADTSNKFIQLCHANATVRGEVGFTSSNSDYNIIQRIHGALIRIYAEDAGGTLREGIRVDGDGSVNVGYAGTFSLRTANRSGSGQTAGADVLDHGGTWRAVGFNLLPTFNTNASDTLEASHCGADNRITGATNATLTLEANTGSDFPTNGVTHLICAGSGSYTVTEGVGTTLYYIEPGTGRVDTTGGCTVGPGGFATLKRLSSTEYEIWGSEITYTP